MQSPFDVLGVDPDADEEELGAAYRQRVLETHPDRGGSTEEFMLVMEAYEAIESGRATDGAFELQRTHADRDWRPGERHVWERNGSRNRHDGPRRQASTRVEYLDYEVLEDFGWSLDDEDLFEKASDAGLDPSDYGGFLVEPHESLLEAAEARGFRWPYACRGGACANCAVAMTEGEMAMPANHILPDEMMEQGIRLSCNGMPTTEEMKVVYNLKHRPDLDDLRLPPHRFERDYLND